MSALSAAQKRALASAQRADSLRGKITEEHATRATMRALEARGLVGIETRRHERDFATNWGRASSRRRYTFESIATLTEAGWEAARSVVRPCTCGGAHYSSCLCNLTPREWIEFAKTHPRVDPSVALPKGWES